MIIIMYNSYDKTTLMQSTQLFTVKILIVHDDQKEMFSSAIIIVFAIPHHIPPIPVTSKKI